MFKALFVMMTLVSCSLALLAGGSPPDDYAITHRGTIYLIQGSPTIGEGSCLAGHYSSWEKLQAGLIVARDKNAYNRTCRFINNNPRNEMYEFAQFDASSVYLFVFAPWADYEPGWSLVVHEVEKNKEDSLLFVVKATATDSKPISTKSSPTNAWKMVKIPSSSITKDTRFQLSIRMDRTETILPTEIK